VIHPNLIKRRADEEGMAAPTVERDYALAHALAAISSAALRAQTVTLGGNGATAAQCPRFAGRRSLQM
jgi:hypothetical protein